MIPKKNTAIILLLFLGTWCLLQNSVSVTPTPIKQSLTSFPTSIGKWKLINSTESAKDIIELLGVDDYLQYTYQNPEGDVITLYVGYYSAVGVSGTYHSPKNCLPGGGWGIETISPVTLQTGIEDNNSSVVSQMLIRNGDRFQIVLYWFQNRGRIIASEYWEKFYLVWDAIRLGRRDGAFVRIMSTVKGKDFASASVEVNKFSQQVMNTLESYLPGSTI